MMYDVILRSVLCQAYCDVRLKFVIPSNDNKSLFIYDDNL